MGTDDPDPLSDRDATGPAVAAPSRSGKLDPPVGASVVEELDPEGTTGARSTTVATDALTTSSLRAVP